MRRRDETTLPAKSGVEGYLLLSRYKQEFNVQRLPCLVQHCILRTKSYKKIMVCQLQAPAFQGGVVPNLWGGG